MKNSPANEGGESQAPSKTKKVLSIIGNVILWLFIAFAIVITIFAFSQQSGADGVPTIGGKVFSPVLSESMQPTIKQGDIILTRKLDDAEKSRLQVGQIITFKVDLDGDGVPEVNTHRIVEVIDDSGIIQYQTKGDNNAINDSYKVAPVDVISVFDPETDTRIPVLGSVIAFLMTSTGFLVVIVIPLLLFFIVEIILFVRKLMEVKMAKKGKLSAEEEELIKKKAIEEYLKAQNAANNGTEEADNNAEEPSEEK